MGWTFNTTNPDAPTDGPQITAVAATMTALALTTVMLRVYVRWGMLNAFGTDDYIIIASWLASLGFTIVSCIQTKWGLGLHNIEDLPALDTYMFGLLQFAGAPFYISSILGFKLSLLFSYLRFFPNGAYRHATWVVIVSTTLFHLTFLLVQINLCSPVRAQWDETVVEKTCLPAVTVYTSMAAITIFFDVIIMVLPFPVFLSLKMQSRKKLVVLGLFGLGIFITVIQIVRIQTVERLTVSTDSAPLILWSTVESNLGIIVASIPCLSPLFKSFRDRTMSASRGKTGKSGYQIGSQVGSQYALQTWKSKAVKDDSASMMDHGLLGHAAAAEGGGGKNGTESTDFIILQSPGPGIVRKTEVVVTRD